MDFHVKLTHKDCIYHMHLSYCKAPLNLYILEKTFDSILYKSSCGLKWKLKKSIYIFSNVISSLFHVDKVGKIVFLGNLA